MDDEEHAPPYHTNRDKWIIALVAGIVFFIVASPYFYGIVDNIMGLIGVHTATLGCPNIIGLVIQAIIYFLIIRILLN